MVIAKRRNDCVDEAIKQKNEALSEIVEQELSLTYRPDLNQRIIEILKLMLWSRHLKTQQGELFNENQNPVTVRLPASNSTTTSPSATVGTVGTTS
ncbi:hypothetical protein Glove_66g181 [Diversispora epigaea]|uniref:Uncharacterized protein n=1 Tax=Diversispora epigaea TaxID=1348612 RepID=A0A397JLE0_9GLOM|nr:hypothetical protein Glove_66g181 [Diversispora epigaea]